MNDIFQQNVNDQNLYKMMNEIYTLFNFSSKTKTP